MADFYRQSGRIFPCRWQDANGICTKQNGISAKSVRADLVGTINRYSSALQKAGYSPATIHTYLAAPCSTLSINLKNIQKPIRSAGTIGRSRGFGNKQGEAQVAQPRFARSVTFEKAVGIRRSELKRLCGNDYVLDAAGHPCVRVKKGKGGKAQLQRILPHNEALVASYFDGSESRIFTPKELTNKIDYHACRAANARAAYAYYVEMLRKSGTRIHLQEELRSRFAEGNPKCSRRKAAKFEKELTNSTPYQLRGENRVRAEDAERPVRYNRLALLAVSVFHLSHWRNDVTVTNYML